MAAALNDRYPFYMGDLVEVDKPAKGLVPGTIYTVTYVNRGVDGAYDFDDVFLEGVEGAFCEFIFRRVRWPM